MRARRRGMMMAVAIGLLFLLGLMVVQMKQSSVQQARMTRTLNTDSEHLYRCEAVLARVVNRLKKRPWLVRFYAQGGLSTGPYEYEESGNYRDGAYQLWVRDVEAGGRVVPGLVDVFLTMDYNEMERQFVYRLSVRGATMRRGASVGVVHFGRTVEDVTGESGRVAAAGEVTEAMQAAEASRPDMRVRIDSLEPVLKPNTMAEVTGQEAPGAAELADRLVDLATADAATLLREDTQKIRTAVHLLGSDGTGFQNLLPPLERGRFTFRSPNHTEAQGLLREVFEGGGAIADRLVAALALGRSLSTEAWAVGPSSDRGRELLEETWRVLEQAEGLLNAASAAELATVDFTLGAGIYTDQMRTAVIAAGAQVEMSGPSWAEREVSALEGFDRIAAGRTLFGGDATPAEVLQRSVEPLRRPAAQARMQSDEAMPGSGFPEVEMGEVESFQEDPEGGWSSFPEDSALSPEYWDEAWDEAVVREGENGTGDRNPNHDRNGDGLPDPSDQAQGVDQDGDGVHDAHVFDEVIAICIRGQCNGSAEMCAESCGDQVIEARDVGEEAFPDAEENPMLESLREEFEGEADAIASGDEDGGGEDGGDEDGGDDAPPPDPAPAAAAAVDVPPPAADVVADAGAGGSSGGGGGFLSRLRDAVEQSKDCFSGCEAASDPPPGCKVSCLFSGGASGGSASSGSGGGGSGGSGGSGFRFRRRNNDDGDDGDGDDGD